MYEKGADGAQEQLKQINDIQLPAVRQELISAQISAQKAQESNAELKAVNDCLKDDNKAIRQEQASLQQESTPFVHIHTIFNLFF